MGKGWKKLTDDNGQIQIVTNKIHWSSCGPPSFNLLLGRYKMDFVGPNRVMLRHDNELIAYLYIKHNQIHGLAMFPANPTHPLPGPWRGGY